MVGTRVIPTEFESEGEVIRGRFVVPSGKGPFPGIAKYHGLPGGSDQVRGIATHLAQAGFAVLIFDFRGFRDSDGLFTLAGEILDAEAAITHLLDSQLTIDSWAGAMASSYGAAVAVCSAARDLRVKAVCIRAPVYDTLWFAKSHMIRPTVKEIVATDPTQVRGIDDPETQVFLLERMIEDAKIHNPMNEIPRISPRPLLVLHGTDDLGIDLAGVKRLYERAGEPKKLVIVEGADHVLSDPVAYEITMRTTVEWFQEEWAKASR